MFKTIAAIVLVMFITSSTYSQANFAVKWESKFENDADYWRYSTENGKYVVGTTKKEVSVISGVNGQPLWKKTFTDIAGVKEAKSQQIIEETETLLFISKQKGNDELFCVDLKTGNKLWSNDQFNEINLGNLIFINGAGCYAVVQKKGLTFIDEKTGKEKGAVEGIKGVIGRYVYLEESNQLILFAYQVNSLKAIGSGLKNNLICIDLNTFQPKWNTTIKGVVEIKKYAGKSFSIFDWATVGVNKGIGSGNVLVDLLVRENKAYVIMNGMQAFDLSNGNKLWEVEFDLSLNRGMAGSSQLYNAVADPLFTKEFIYMAAFEKGRDKSIKKYDIETGKLIWETPVNGRKIIIPKISLVNGLIVAQIGGYVNLQGEDKGSYFSKWKWQGPFGLKGFDAETGKLKWETEKFDDRITNMLVNDNALFVADESNLFSINTATGEKAFEVKLKDAKTGKAQYIFNSNGRIMILGEDGLTAFNSKGNMEYSFTAKNASMNSSDEYGDNLYYVGTDDEIIAFDITTGKEIGRFEFKKGYIYGIKNSGKTFMLYKDNKVTSYQVN
ncbi:MAG TPA: PQQ-binding-like beta-propeller repeat protein [Chitinophagaceae bacterium]